MVNQWLQIEHGAETPTCFTNGSLIVICFPVHITIQRVLNSLFERLKEDTHEHCEDKSFDYWNGCFAITCAKWRSSASTKKTEAETAIAQT